MLLNQYLFVADLKSASAKRRAVYGGPRCWTQKLGAPGMRGDGRVGFRTAPDGK